MQSRRLRLCGLFSAQQPLLSIAARISPTLGDDADIDLLITDIVMYAPDGSTADAPAAG